MTNQIKFIEMANNMKPAGGINQTDDGNTVVQLRDNIQIIHNYKRRNEISILFQDTNERYIIPDQKELEFIYRTHLGEQDILQKLHQHAEETYKKIE